MSAEFINRIGPTLRFHLEKTAPSEELKHRLDDMCLNHIPRPWPIITQLLLIENVYGGIVEILSDPVSRRLPLNCPKSDDLAEVDGDA